MRARDLAHRLLDGEVPLVIAGRQFSGHWWITTTGALAVQDKTGATHHHDLDANVTLEWMK